MTKTSKGFLVLETGEVFEGCWNELSTGRLAPSAGELVFNTSHAGYQEIASDPSYFGQIMVMTAPMQGNYGQRSDDMESKKYWIEAFVCLEIERRNNIWIDELLKQNIPVLSDIDTRSLTLRLREGGATWGVACTSDSSESAKALAREHIQKKKTLIGQDWTQLVCRQKSQVVKGQGPADLRIAVVDYGIKENILREVLKRVGEVKVFPSQTGAREIQDYVPTGILLSNGPGDPAWVKKGVETARELLGWKPIFGICMGHQVLSLAVGASTFKMKFGHHGGNHPVRDVLLEKVYITSQNHGYAVDPGTLPTGARVTQTNLYDNSVEGFEFLQKKCFSVQYHPESAPGPNDAVKLFDRFVDSLK